MSLNSKQKIAVACDDHCLVVACPGSGKSTLVVTKVQTILNAEPDANIIVTTFSREGANELRARLKPLLSDEQMRHVFVSTFHSLALAHLKREKIPIRIAKDTNEYLLRAISTVSVKLGENIEFEDAQKLLQNGKTTPRFKPGNDVAGLLYKEFQSICKHNNVVDFYDIMNLSLEKIRTGSMPILNASHMLVDEFQDCDEIQYQYMMEHVKSGKVKVTVVGDDDQAIYAFRNSLGYSGMARFETEARAVRVILDTNYRCRKEILAAAGVLIKHNGARMDKQLIAHRGAGGKIVVNRYVSRQAEAKEICQSIIEIGYEAKFEHFSDNRDLYPILVPGKKWVILARNNRLLEAADAMLKEFSIPAIKNFKPIWERSPVSLMLSLMKSFDSKEKTNINHLLYWAGIPNEDLLILSTLLENDYSKLFNKQYTSNLNTQELSKNSSIKLKSFITDVNGWAKGESRSDPGRTRDVISSIGMWMLSQTKKNIEKERLGLAIEVLLKVKGSMLERVNFVTKKDNAESKSEETQGNEVHLMTMHGSKGLEFDYVWIIAAEHTVIPSEASVVVSEETMNEERRLMYVAMTRAKDVLYISSTAEHSISIFLKEAKLIK